MIKKYTLTFNSSELEQSFNVWIIDQSQNMYEFTLATFSIYLILNLINYNQSIIYIITTSVTLCIELTMLFFFRRYPMQREVIKSLNLIVISILIGIYIWLNQSQNIYIEVGAARLCLYLQGNIFTIQTAIFLFSQAAELSILQQQMIPLIKYSVFCVYFIYHRYQTEMNRRQHYLAYRSQILYENFIEEQLPAWVVLVKYDTKQAQLKMDKINRVMKDTFNLNSDQKFREFLRDSNIQPLEGINHKAFSFEDELIKDLLQKQQNDKITKFVGRFVGNDKKGQFQITKIYFNTLEPTILLLFIEEGDDLFDFFTHQLQWRDQQLVNHSKACVKYIKDQINLLKFLKQQATTQQLYHINNQISNSYLLFNQSLNIFNITKIIYNKLKYHINQFNLQDLITQLKEDLKFSNKQLLFDLELKTDRSKMISVILSISEFIRLMLAINSDNEKQLYEIHPLGFPIQIKFKRIYTNPGCLLITMKHQLLNIPIQIQEFLSKGASFTDHKKRNWGVNHYYENIQNLSDQFHKINVTTHNLRNGQMPCIELDLNLQQQQQRIEVNLDGSTEPFSTLGLPLAQYLISQIGPNNQIQFQDKPLKHFPDPLSFRNATTQTKIQFKLYEDLNQFIYQLNQQDPNPYLDFFISNSSQKGGFKTYCSMSPQNHRKSGMTSQLINFKLN
ncbi:unnamed protein product (macronuclear) [Paramecium tetraurelia]|uniref:Transmembrane protein n=1 Tax=Paramecium tetraurelia TaxID=5888 RepID=A0BMZ6_PARTE|nr:uncharacterized protein GSPATT00030550001 [Paramecium tetraurelia]CAK59913.1 unnamed protein product [Paramecium tetraurelia]|eukprot:XP_001427311.1 hypothetical protein (macronuclear) [Paramecium tetraurelia strain d4-2]